MTNFELLRNEINELLIRTKSPKIAKELNYLLEFADNLGNGWINVDDELPEHEQMVLAYRDSFKCGDLVWQCLYLDGEGFMSFPTMYKGKNDKITHWQPFPQLPNGDLQ